MTELTAQRRWELPVAAAILLSATLAWLWPLPASLGTHLVAAPYWWDAQLNTFILAQGGDNLIGRSAGLFDSAIMHPAPEVLAWSENLLALAVLGAVPRALGAGPLAVHNFLVIAGVWGTGLATFVLLRRRAGFWPSLISAALVAFAPYRLGWLSRVQLVSGFGLPLLVLTTERLIEAPGIRRGLALGAALALQAGVGLYGLVQLLMILGPTALLHALWRWWSPAPWVRVARALLGLAPGALVTLLLISPYQRAREAQGFVRDEKMLANTSGLYADLRTTSDLMARWRDSAVTVKETSAREPVASPGVLAAGLAALVLVPRRRKRGAAPPDGGAPSPCFTPWVFVCWLPVTLVMFLGTGPDAPQLGVYAWLREHLPGLSGLRYPCRVVAVTSLALAVLGAVGLERIGSWCASFLTPRRPGPTVAWAVLGFAALCETLTVSLPLRAHETPNPSYEVVASFGGQALIELPFDTGKHEPRVLRNLGPRVHGLWLVNGYTGYEPAFAKAVRQRLDGFPDAESHELLHALGVDRVLAHRATLPARGAILLRAAQTTPWLRVLHADGDALLLAVTDVPNGRAAEVRAAARAFLEDRPTPPAGDRSSWRIEVPGGYNPEGLRDDDQKTRYTTGAVQSRDADWLTVRFPEPRTVSAIWLDVREGIGDAPLGLRVSSEGQLLFEDRLHSGIVPLAAAPQRAYDVVRFPPRSVQSLTIGNTERSPDRWGSIHELWVD